MAEEKLSPSRRQILRVPLAGLLPAGAAAQETFQGTIGRTTKDSIPSWPTPVRAPQGAPNVLWIVIDDMGFGHSSPFGGPIEMPNLERLARGGLRYTNFHTTALCSPTRSALLSGRNHHSVGFGVISEISSGYPGYKG